MYIHPLSHSTHPNPCFFFGTVVDGVEDDSDGVVSMARQESLLISCGSFTRFGIFRSEVVSECSLFFLAWFWW